MTGLPKQITLSSEEVREAVQECAAAIADAARRVLEDTPPELASDIFLNGVVMTGGGSLIYGIDRYLSEVLSVPVTVAERAEECVGVGTENHCSLFHKEHRAGRGPISQIWGLFAAAGRGTSHGGSV